MPIMKQFRSKKRVIDNACPRSKFQNLLRRYTLLTLWFLDPIESRDIKRLAERIADLQKHNGDKFTVCFLKECVRLVNHWCSGNPTSTPPHGGGPRVASRRGLPLILPGPLRLRMEAGDQVIIRTVLTILSIFRIIKYPGTLKLSTITDPFTGWSKTLDVYEVAGVWAKKFASRVPKPFTGLDNLLMLKTAGPNFSTSIIGASIDAYAWKHIASDRLWKAYLTISDHFTSPLGAILKAESEIVSGWENTRSLKLGKLSKKLEPAGKIRVFAIADVWTQSVLEPLHSWIFSFLRGIPDVDGTFDQAGPLRSLQDKLSKKDNKFVASYDLSAATDRLPIDLQVQVLSQFTGNRELAEAWKTLLVERDWWFADQSLRYSVGQPMGALSSWGMLALTHHFIVQLASYRVGHTAWFDEYAILGDDVVIADEAVAASYHSLMTEYLGVEINLSKSIISHKGVMEFAKRVVGPEGELTPLGPKNIAQVLKNKGNIPTLFLDFVGKGGTLSWANVVDKVNALSRRSDIIRVRSSDLEAIIWSVLRPFGFIDGDGLTSSEIVSSLSSYSPFKVMRNIVDVLASQDDKDRQSAIMTTYKTMIELQNSIPSFGERLSFKTWFPTPSFLMTLEENSKVYEKLTENFGRVYDIGEGPCFLPDNYWKKSRTVEVSSPSDVNSLRYELHKVLVSRPEFSPLDNPLVRPRITRPRVRHAVIGLFKEVLRRCASSYY